MNLHKKIMIIILGAIGLVLLSGILEGFGIKTDFLKDQRIHEFFQSSSTYEYVDLDGKFREIRM